MEEELQFLQVVVLPSGDVELEVRAFPPLRSRWAELWHWELMPEMASMGQSLGLQPY